MVRKIHGWNDIPEGFHQEVDFNAAPFWLRSLARIKYLERYAYPIAVKRNLVTRWALKPQPARPSESWDEGIRYLNKSYPGFAYKKEPKSFELRKSKFPINFSIMKIFALIYTGYSVVKIIFRSIFSSRWGNERKSEYMKEKIAESKGKM